jgi:hypothetical protein
LEASDTRVTTPWAGIEEDSCLSFFKMKKRWEEEEKQQYRQQNWQ